MFSLFHHQTTLRPTSTTTSPSADVSEQLAGKPEHTLEPPLRRNEEKERPPLVKTNLTRSKSMGSLVPQHGSGGGTGALRALFESKRDTPRPVAMRAARPAAPPGAADATPDVKEGFAWNETRATEKREQGLTSAGASIAMPDDGDAEANAKGDGMTLKVNC